MLHVAALICSFVYQRCSCHNVAPDETCADCLKSKANTGRLVLFNTQLYQVENPILLKPHLCKFDWPFPRSTGILDDLEFLLDEELSSIQLCSLHMEMRNTKQLLGSIGLVAYKIDSLKDANDTLRIYGPESFKGDRLTVQKKAGQETKIAKHNIPVSSMSGI